MKGVSTNERPTEARSVHVSKLFYGKRFHRGTLGTRCAHPPFAPVAPPRAPTSEKNAAGHVASRLVAILEISAADARDDADRRAPTAPFTQAKSCDSLTDWS